MFIRAIITIFALLAMSCTAIADDWVASKLRGGVFVFDNGAWLQIKRGHVVSDDSAIQTAKGARVTFKRGKESIDIRSDTRIRISDKSGSKRTVVSQDFGTITVDVEKRNVKHFEVRTQLLAAVVKGTRFSVSLRDGVAQVDVERGRVEVNNRKNRKKADLLPDQTVKVSNVRPSEMVVTVTGTDTPVVAPQVQAQDTGNQINVDSNVPPVSVETPINSVETVVATPVVVPSPPTGTGGSDDQTVVDVPDIAKSDDDDDDDDDD